MIIVADTSPLNYLVLIGEAEILRRLYGRVIIPEAVWRELRLPALRELGKGDFPAGELCEGGPLPTG